MNGESQHPDSFHTEAVYPGDGRYYKDLVGSTTPETAHEEAARVNAWLKDTYPDETIRTHLADIPGYYDIQDAFTAQTHAMFEQTLDNGALEQMWSEEAVAARERRASGAVPANADSIDEFVGDFVERFRMPGAPSIERSVDAHETEDPQGTIE